jgi:hypothetical protein
MTVRWSVAVGVVLGVLGVAALVVPELTTVLPANEGLVLFLGILLVLGGVRDVWRRRTAEHAYAEPSDTEQPVELPTPGREFDRRLGRLSTLVHRGNVRRRVRDEVTDVATETLQRRVGYTASEAEAALEAGTWTDDPFAAAFFTGRPPETDPLSRARELFRSGSSFQHRARRAADELYRLAEETDADDRE